jgi:hypothetical protein
LKNARDPERHSAFASVGDGWGAGIGMVSGRHFGSFVGSSVGAMVGSRPTSDSFVNVPHPLSSQAQRPRQIAGRIARRAIRSAQRPPDCIKTVVLQAVRFDGPNTSRGRLPNG